MANTISSKHAITSFYLTSCCILFLLSLCCMKAGGDAVVPTRKIRETIEVSHISNNTDDALDVVTSLIPTDTCKRPPLSQGSSLGTGASLVLINRWCGMDKESAPTLDELLQWDRKRVESIQAQFSALDNLAPEHTVHLNAIWGQEIGSASYVVSVGLGTPQQPLYLIFDTGSYMTWTQCLPCKDKCYVQKYPIFNPKKSTTYEQISECGEKCRLLNPEQECKDDSKGCSYRMRYGDDSSTSGSFARDKLTLTKELVLDKYIFGCGQNNTGKFNGSSGIMGLGKHKELSILSQGEAQIGDHFSYCLPTGGTGRLGYLYLGKKESSQNLVTTKLILKEKHPSHYFVELRDISVDGTRLNLKSVFEATNDAVLDSGTLITNLPKEAYEALRDKFREKMSKNTNNIVLQNPSKDSVLDTCYDVTKHYRDQVRVRVRVPEVSLHFSNEAKITLSEYGVFSGNHSTKCLLFRATTPENGSLPIIGNAAQMTFDVVYDIPNHSVGFAPKGCT